MPTLTFLQLLDRNPKTRLGCRDKDLGIDDIRNHPWMKSIDWDSIENKEAQPPFVPDVRFPIICRIWLSLIPNPLNR